MTVFYEGGSVKTKLTGKEIIAEMASRTDPVHWKIMKRLQDECSHDYPTYHRNSGAEACCGCHRTPAEIGARKLEIELERQEELKPPPYYKGPMRDRNPTVGRYPQPGEWIG